MDATITFLGVWDTVGSLGIPGHLLAEQNQEQFAFHDTTPSPIVRKGVHALAIDEHRLLVIERAGVQDALGVFHEFVRVYEMDVRGATDVKAMPALAGASYTAASKRLVLDMNALNLPRLDNIEGISWGPTLANGHASLVMVSDDNFHDKIQVTQFLVFEVLPR